MIFDQPPSELPVATLVPRDGRSRLRADFYAWLVAKWRWFKPRTVPMIVAFVGMFAVIGSANWLRNYARREPERLDVEAAKRAAIYVVDAQPEAAEAPTITVEGEVKKLTDFAVTPSRCGFSIGAGKH